MGLEQIKLNFLKLKEMYNIQSEDIILSIDEVEYTNKLSLLKLMTICIELGVKNANRINNSYNNIDVID